MAALTFLLLAAAPMAVAHAVLVRSTPSDGSVIHSRNLILTLDFNSRIDGRRSTLTLTGPKGRSLPMAVQHNSRPSELQAPLVNLAPGTYRIQWQVLASDGHITRGEVSFTVAKQ